MSRIKSLFSSPKEKVIPFYTAGYPKLNSTVDLVIASCDAGADMIEIGIPFSDPQADGPVIQASSQKALENGITINKIFLAFELSAKRRLTSYGLSLLSSYFILIFFFEIFAIFFAKS